GSASPAQVAGLDGAVAVAAGFSHSLALKGDGTVWAWGDNQVGQLGTGSSSGPDTCGSDLYPHACSKAPVQVAALGGVTAVAAGGYGGWGWCGDSDLCGDGHSLALKAD